MTRAIHLAAAQFCGDSTNSGLSMYISVLSRPIISGGEMKTVGDGCRMSEVPKGRKSKAKAESGDGITAQSFPTIFSTQDGLS